MEMTYYQKKIDQNIIIFSKKENFIKGVFVFLVSLIKYFFRNFSLKRFSTPFFRSKQTLLKKFFKFNKKKLILVE